MIYVSPVTKARLRRLGVVGPVVLLPRYKNAATGTLRRFPGTLKWAGRGLNVLGNAKGGFAQ